MAITPPGDIVLDVARAADPVKFQAATRKLSEIASPASATEFANVFNDTQAGALLRGSLDSEALRVSIRNNSREGGGDAARVHQEFEAFVLQSFIESMLPKDSETLFGKGTAGNIWKSMLAEQIGAQLAKAGGIGIANKLVAARRDTDQVEGLKSSHLSAAVRSSDLFGS